MKSIKIGTRGSKLALIQAGMVADALRAAHPDVTVETIVIQTSGDWKPEQGETRLSEVEGGKGLFAREIERAILDGTVDCGVHSLKDMPSFLPDGLQLTHTLARADCRDVLLINGPYRNIDELPAGSVIGTSSLRRQALILNRRPDLKIAPLRGNVPTRIEKMKGGQVAGCVLALAGLARLGLAAEARQIFEVEDMVPAACQGIIAVETRTGDNRVHGYMQSLHDPVTGFAAAAERAALATLDGSCHTPIGAHAVVNQNIMTLRVLVASPDGQQIFKDAQTGPVAGDEDAANLGRLVGLRLKARVPAEIMV